MSSFSGFSVNLEHPDYRRALVLDERIAARQRRIAAKPPADAQGLPYFLAEANRWLPSGQNRLLWVDHWEFGSLHNSEALVLAARAGLGEMRNLEEAPGHLFDAHPYDELDCTEITTEQRTDAGILIGLMSLIVIERADGWLIASGAQERIEFWEGNVFFHSENADKLDSARTLLKNFACELWATSA